MKQILLTLLSTFAAFTLSAQTSVSDYIPGTTTEGITYYLPSTHLHITVTATRQHYEPGEYAAYAERFLRLEGTAQQAYDHWAVKAIEICPYGVADPERVYSVKLKPKTSAPHVRLSEDGVLLAINAEAPALPVLSVEGHERSVQTFLNADDYKTAEILAAGSKLKMAELAAAEIYDIRENRALLAKGQADFMPQDGEQLKLMLASLDTQETALLSLFKGNTTEETHTFVLDYMPTGDTTDEVLFRFSRFLGMVERDDLSGEPYYLQVKDGHTLPEEVIDPKAKNKAEEDVRYCVPSRATIRIYDAQQDWANLTTPIAQFGRIEHLGGDLFNKKFTTAITFSPVTGAILSVNTDQ